MHLCRSSSNAPRLPSFLDMLQNLHVLPTFDTVHNPLRLPRETTSEPLKVKRACGVLYILTSKCASHHNGAHFFDISSSKSGATLVCFVHFDFEMCFTPQQRALFRHLNFQKWSEPDVLCTFWLGNVLRAATACTFSSLIWPDGSAPAALASLLFDPPEPQIIGKTRCFAAFLPFRASASSFFRLFLFYHLLSLFCSSLLSASAHLCFSSVHIVGRFTSKLPSMIISIYLFVIFLLIWKGMVLFLPSLYCDGVSGWRVYGWKYVSWKRTSTSNIAMVLSIDFEVAMALKEVLQAKGELKVRPKIQDFSIRRHRTVREASKLSLALWNVPERTH